MINKEKKLWIINLKLETLNKINKEQLIKSLIYLLKDNYAYGEVVSAR